MRHLGPACLLIALSGVGLNAVAAPAAGDDPAGDQAEALPSIELLEYLAEFEDAADGTLLDPVDLPQRTLSGNAAQNVEPWGKHR